MIYDNSLLPQSNILYLFILMYFLQHFLTTRGFIICFLFFSLSVFPITNNLWVDFIHPESTAPSTQHVFKEIVFKYTKNEGLFTLLYYNIELLKK